MVWPRPRSPPVRGLDEFRETAAVGWHRGLGLILALYFVYSICTYFGNVSFLGGILLLEIIVASCGNMSSVFSFC